MGYTNYNNNEKDSPSITPSCLQLQPHSPSPPPPSPSQQHEEHNQSPSPPHSCKRSGEPVTTVEQRSRLFDFLDTSKSFDKAQLDGIYDTLQDELEKIKNTIYFFTEDANNRLLDGNYEERLGEAIQSLHLAREILTYNKKLYSPYFNQDANTRISNKYTTMTNTERAVSAIYCDVINIFFAGNEDQSAKILPNFVVSKVSDEYIVSLEEMHEVVEIYNNVRMAKVVSWNKDKLYEPIAKAFIQRIDNISDDEIKKFNTQAMNKTSATLISLVDDAIMYTVKNELKNALIGFVIRCIKSEIMDKRLFGLKKVVGYIRSFEKDYYGNIKAIDRICSEVIPIIFGRSSHIDLIKESEPIIKFVFNVIPSGDDKKTILFITIWNSIIVNYYYYNLFIIFIYYYNY